MEDLRNNRAGFSFIELLIVLAIMAILGTFAISNLYRSRLHAQLERGEILVTNVLKEARNLAVSEEVNTRVVFNNADGTMTTDRQDGESGVWTQVGDPQELTEGVTFVDGGNTLPSLTASFTPRGTLVAGGQFAIQNGDGDTATFVGNVVTGKFPIGGGNLR